MPALLGHAGVIDDPGPDWGLRLHGWKHQVPDRRQDGPVGPGRLGHEMMQGLVRCADPSWLDPGRYRLHALAPAWQHQPNTIRPERGDPVRMPQSSGQPLHIGAEA
jgi:hypothetical protein